MTKSPEREDLRSCTVTESNAGPVEKSQYTIRGLRRSSQQMGLLKV